MWLGQELLLPSPLKVMSVLLEFVGRPAFWGAVGFSFVRIVGGFVLAFTTGILLAVLAARYRSVRILLTPLTAAVKATPGGLLHHFGAGVDSLQKPFGLYLLFVVLPVVYINCLQGILGVDSGLLEMARVFRVPPRRRLLYIYLPDVMPYLISAASLSLGLCWKSAWPPRSSACQTARLARAFMRQRCSCSQASSLPGRL